MNGRMRARASSTSSNVTGSESDDAIRPPGPQPSRLMAREAGRTLRSVDLRVNRRREIVAVRKKNLARKCGAIYCSVRRDPTTFRNALGPEFVCKSFSVACGAVADPEARDMMTREARLRAGEGLGFRAHFGEWILAGPCV